MAKQTLLIDQGNTRLKWVLALDNEIDETSTGHGNLLEFKQAIGSDDSIRPDAVMFSSVADQAGAQALSDYCASRWSLKPQLLKSKHRQGGVTNAYSEPGILGVDRWLAIVGAVARYGKPVVVWDLGTASTLDAVDGDGQHLGGMIYPGPATMLKSLSRDTKLQVPQDSSGATLRPGDSTADCIRNGVLAAQVGALNQFLRNLPQESGDERRIVVTGGAAGVILPLLDFKHIQDTWLVFRGMLVD